MAEKEVDILTIPLKVFNLLGFFLNKRNILQIFALYMYIIFVLIFMMQIIVESVKMNGNIENFTSIVDSTVTAITVRV